MPGNAGTCGASPCAPMIATRSGSARGAVCYNRRSRMVKTEREYREDIVKVGRLVFEKGWVAANDGNISIRLDAERILATPTGMCKGMMEPEDLIVLDRRGRKISGHRERTTEIN